MGHFCRTCQRSRANEKFTGRGHRDHICKDCQKMPRAERDSIERLDELHGFLCQSNISQKNLVRLNILKQHADPEVAKLGELIHDIARLFPGKRKRWLKLAQTHRTLFNRALVLLGIEYFEDLSVDLPYLTPLIHDGREQNDSSEGEFSDGSYEQDPPKEA